MNKETIRGRAIERYQGASPEDKARLAAMKRTRRQISKGLEL